MNLHRKPIGGFIRVLLRKRNQGQFNWSQQGGWEMVGEGGGGGGRRRREAVISVSSLPFPLFSLILRKSEVEAKGEMNRNVPQK